MKKEMPATEFVRWQVYFEKQVNAKKVEYWYHAQTASEIACLPYRVWGQKPPDALRNPKTFLLKFGEGIPTDEQIEKKIKDRDDEGYNFSEYNPDVSRAAWLSFVGMNPDGTLIDGKFEVNRPPGSPQPPGETVQAEAVTVPSTVPKKRGVRVYHGH